MVHDQLDKSEKGREKNKLQSLNQIADRIVNRGSDQLQNLNQWPKRHQLLSFKKLWKVVDQARRFRCSTMTSKINKSEFLDGAKWESSQEHPSMVHGTSIFWRLGIPNVEKLHSKTLIYITPYTNISIRRHKYTELNLPCNTYAPIPSNLSSLSLLRSIFRIPFELKQRRRHGWVWFLSDHGSLAWKKITQNSSSSSSL